METHESHDPKRELLKKSARLRQGLEEEVKVVSERTERIITNALIIGGSLALSYFLVRQLTKPAPKQKSVKQKRIAQRSAETHEFIPDEEPGIAQSMIAQIGTALVSQASEILLTLAKEKLLEYLQSQLEKNSANHERP